MHNQSPESPDFLDQRGDVRRLNRVPLMITGVLVLLILVAITYTYQMRLAEIQERAAQAENKPSAATPSEVFREAPDGGFIPAKREIVEPTPVPDMTPVNDFDSEALDRERYRQEQERIMQARNAATLQALQAPTAISHKEVTANARSKPELEPSTNGTNSLYIEALQRHLAATYGEQDVNRAAEKVSWLNDRKPESGAAHYLPGGREAPVSL